MICGSGGSKSRLAKAAGAEPAGQTRDEKLHAVVARRCAELISKSKCTKHTMVGPLWKLRCRKSARRCGARHISKWKCTKHTMVGPLLEVEMSKKCTPLWREAHFEVKMYKKHTMVGPLLEVEMSKKCTQLWCKAHFQVKMYKTHHGRTTFGGSDVVSRGRRKGLCTSSKVSKTWGFCSISKNDGRRGTFEEDLQRCIFRGRRSTKDMFMRDVRRSGRWFPERGCILEYQMCRFAKMILRDRCSTSYDLASIFPGRRSTLDRWIGKIAKGIGTKLSALHSTFHFWRKSRKIVLFLMLSSSKIEEVSQNCFVLDVVKCKKMKKSRRIVSFWMLLRSKIKEVSQNCLLADR